MSVYDKIFPPRVLTLPNGKQVSKPRSRAPLAAVILVLTNWVKPTRSWHPIVFIALSAAAGMVFGFAGA